VRTTITIEPDVEALIQKIMRERGTSFKEVVNSGLRSGLAPNRERKSFQQRTFAMGSPQDFRWEKALAAADALEDEELVRKLSLRK
jgi:hypothetical protein